MHADDPAVAVGRVFGWLGAIAGAIASLAMFGAFGPMGTERTVASDGTVTTRSEAGLDYLVGNTTGNAPVLFFWGTVAALAAALVVYGVRTQNLALLWALATGLSLLAVLGVWSIGWLVAPFAALTLLSAVFVTVGRRRDRYPADSGPVQG